METATKEGAVASIVTGASVTIIWTYLFPSWEGFSKMHPFLQELTYPAAGLSVLVLIIVSLATPAPPKRYTVSSLMTARLYKLFLFINVLTIFKIHLI